MRLIENVSKIRELPKAWLQKRGDLRGAPRPAGKCLYRVLSLGSGGGLRSDPDAASILDTAELWTNRWRAKRHASAGFPGLHSDQHAACQPWGAAVRLTKHLSQFPRLRIREPPRNRRSRVSKRRKRLRNE